MFLQIYNHYRDKTTKSPDFPRIYENFCNITLMIQNGCGNQLTYMIATAISILSKTILQTKHHLGERT